MPAELSSDPGFGLLLVPQAPMIRTIFLKEGGKQKLFFPHTLFCLFYFKDPDFRLKRLHVTFSKIPFTGQESDAFYGLPVRNHDGCFATCFYDWPSDKDEEKFIHKVIGQYWASPFGEYNDWASWWSERYAALKPEFLKEWLKATEEQNYDWIFDQDFLQADHHVDLEKLIKANKTHVTGGVKFLNLPKPKIEFNF